MTHRGDLIYGKTRRTTDAVIVSIDPETGMLGSPQVAQPLVAYGLGGLFGIVRYAPDGRNVLQTPSQGAVLIQSADAQSRTLMPQLARVGRVEWAADSRSLIISGARDAREEGIYRVDLTTGVATLIVAEPSVALHVPSPDGTILYYRKPQGPLVARDLRGGSERVLVATPVDPIFDLRVSPDSRTLALVGLAEDSWTSQRVRA